MKTFAIAAVAATFLAGAANAAVVTVSSISGVWNSVLGGVNVAGVNTNNLSWGTGGSSSYLFTPEAVPFSPAASPFDVGLFTHFNQPIGSGSSITGASLDLTVAGDVDGQAFSLSSTSVFSHFETPNNTAPCPGGDSIPCGDLVTLISSISTGDMLTLADGSTVTLELTGFGGGLSFLSAEGGNNSDTLQATFKVTPVPLPAGFPLLLAGIGAFALLKRRKKAA